ncbi:uronyl 2-sulfotransferase a isoform X1 [Anguilla anguilla]|uniref:uronyl 2-sulfotransferase a isoform X1 n=2 Tax=Anguilla anguilla TaxID=7936 RepID=UPI0015AE3CDA|nr:uronyl 2-sulfotransferase a isoform X1 [Anguilla anguilla]
MMKNYSNSPHHKNQTLNHTRDRNNKRSNWLSATLLRFSLRDYGFCMATLFLFCFGSLFYQLNGGPPKILLEIRQYLGVFGKSHWPMRMASRHSVHRDRPGKGSPLTFRKEKKGESTFVDDHGPPAPRVLPFPSQVVYNRVGKCGSRTVVLLLRILAERHQFNLVSSDIHNKTRLTKHEQVDLMRNISNIPQPYLYTRHVHFLNFTRFRIEQPVYINIIRDPINRFLSNYFFRRFGDWRGEQNHLIRTPGMKDDERYLDINVCILENYPECSNPRLFYIIPYFCGQHPQCREPGLWALERAKQNVLENFLLVGVLEELEDVLLLLERLLPHFFTDVLNIYKSPDYRKMGNMTGTVRKQTPSLEALQALYQRMRYEYDFYNFVREQFHLTKRKIGLKSASRPTHQPNFLLNLALKTQEPLEEDEEEEQEPEDDVEDANSWLAQP